jgi:two-component system, cell cycle sensor histidine kinase and response regulator CckA
LLEEAQALGHMGSWALDLEQDKLEWSSEFRRILDVPLGTLATPECFMQRLHPDDRQSITAVHEAVLRTGTAAQADVRIVHDAGELRFVRIVGMPHNDGSGRVRQIRGTMLDLTDQRRLQERLAQAEKMEAIGRLAGGIAHDFNNLLMVVQGNLELMDAGDRPELRAILSAVESAHTLTAGLLAFGRKARLQRQVVDLNELVTGTVALLGRLVGEHITLRGSTDPKLPEVDVDRSLIQQALVNLVINARDALGHGGVISVRTRAVSEGGVPYAELSVEDDGPGIDAATRARLFEPFFTTKADGKGSGLGLAMVHGTVTQHGGTVRVDSQAGRGTCFTLRIPAVAADTSPTARASSPPPPPRPVQERTILVVEDQPAVAHLLSLLLRRAGHRVLVAERPSRALELAQQHPSFDLLLCDLMMPEMHGTALAAELRRDRPGLPVLFISGYGGDAAHVPAGSKVLGKPFSIADLHAAIQDTLEPRRASIPAT